MQSFAKNFIKNVKARAGYPVDGVNFHIEYCRIFMPQSMDNAQNINSGGSEDEKVLSTTVTQLVKARDYQPSVQSLNQSSLDMRVVNKNTLSPASQKQIKNANSGTWKDVVFVKSTDISTTKLNHQFSEPINNSERGVRKNPASKRDFGKQTLAIGRQWAPFFTGISDNNALWAEVREHEKYLTQEKFRLQHPQWGYINVSIDGDLEIEPRIDIGMVFIRFNIKEVTADLNDTTPPTTPAQDELSTLDKIRNAYSKVRNYTFATVAEFTATVNQLDKITGLMTTISNDISGLSANTVNSLNAFNRLADGIRIFKNSIPTLLNIPSELGNKKREILSNLRNVISGNDTPTKYSTDSYNKNITLLSSAQKMLSPTEFASDNNILLQSTDKVAKASYELMTATKHVEACTVAILLMGNADFNSENEIMVAVDSLADVIESLSVYELFLGRDIYKNKITHKIENLTLEIIEMVDALLVIYNNLMFRLLNEALVLSYKKKTNVVRMPTLKLLHCVYLNEYDLSDPEAEHIYFDRLCRLNPSIYQNSIFANGLIKY